MLGSPGIGFQCDFDIIGIVEPCRDMLQQSRQGVRLEKTGGAASEKNAAQGFARFEPGELVIQVVDQRLNVTRLIEVLGQPMTVEVTIWAFFHTPGEVHIERERRGGDQVTRFCGEPSRQVFKLLAI